MPVILTVGHSSGSLDDLIRVLFAHRVHTLVDVRRYAGSRRHPHFDKRQLGDALLFEAIGYFHEPDLGGMRQPRANSENNALEGPFRGYADHMASPEFRRSFERVSSLASRELCALMCAEQSPTRCHRRYLADAFELAGFTVHHALGPDSYVVHDRHPEARIGPDGAVVYRRPIQLRLFE